MLRVVFDTNIYLSAFFFGGIPRQLINLAFEGVFQLYISADILNEISSVADYLVSGDKKHLHRRPACTDRLPLNEILNSRRDK